MTKDYANRLNASRRRQAQKRQQESHAGLWVFTIAFFILFTLGLVALGKYRQHSNTAAKNFTEVTTSELNLHEAKARDTTTEDAIESIALSKDSKRSEKNDKKDKNDKSTRGISDAEQHLQFEFTTPEEIEKAIAHKDKKVVTSDKKAGGAKEEKKDSKEMKDQSMVEEQVETSSEQELMSKIQQVEQQHTKVDQSDAEQGKGRYMLNVIKTKDYASADKMRARLALAGYEANIVTVTEQNVNYYTIVLGPFATKSEAAKQQKLLAGSKIKAALTNR